MDKEKLIVSFSGGRTSGFMSKMLMDHYSDTFDLKFVFANTGQEHENTLKFVDQCDKAFGLNLTWLEAVVHHEHNRGTTYRVVDFDSASRHGEPFRELMKKYGIANKSYPHCNRELKLKPIIKWQKDNGFFESEFALGIRADELDRINPDSKKDQNIVYPLAFWFPSTKGEILNWWAEQNFDLEIPEHYGNCLTCWKKSDRKLFTIAKERPEWFDFFAEMEAKYSKVKTRSDDERRVFFRQHRSTMDILKQAGDFPEHKMFREEIPAQQLDFFGLDQAGGACGDESCEPFSE